MKIVIFILIAAESPQLGSNSCTRSLQERVLYTKLLVLNEATFYRHIMNGTYPVVFLVVGRAVDFRNIFTFFALSTVPFPSLGDLGLVFLASGGTEHA